MCYAIATINLKTRRPRNQGSSSDAFAETSCEGGNHALGKASLRSDRRSSAPVHSEMNGLGRNGRLRPEARGSRSQPHEVPVLPGSGRLFRGAFCGFGRLRHAFATPSSGDVIDNDRAGLAPGRLLSWQPIVAPHDEAYNPVVAREPRGRQLSACRLPLKPRRPHEWSTDRCATTAGTNEAPPLVAFLTYKSP
jgi:hypothetical protein